MDSTKRIYHIKDGELKEHGHTVLKEFVLDLGTFSSFDSTFSQQTVDNLDAALKKADAEVKDVTVVAGIKGGTQTVKGLLQQCHEAYEVVDYFVDKAFGDNEAVKGEFMIDKLHKMDTQTGMIELMETITIALNKYSAALIESGMSQEQIDAITPLAEELKNANSDQEVSKDGRPVVTQSRVGAMNDLFKILKQISDAAPMVFKGNEAKIKAYRLPTA